MQKSKAIMLLEKTTKALLGFTCLLLVLYVLLTPGALSVLLTADYNALVSDLLIILSNHILLDFSQMLAIFLVLMTCLIIVAQGLLFVSSIMLWSIRKFKPGKVIDA